MAEKWQEIGISESSIRKAITEESWEKGKHKAKIEEKIQAKTIDLLAKHGITPEKQIELFVSALDAEKLVNIGGQPVNDADWSSRLKAHDMLFKLRGDYAPEKVNQTISGGINVTKDDDLSNLTTEEIIQLKALKEKMVK